MVNVCVRIVYMDPMGHIFVRILLGVIQVTARNIANIDAIGNSEHYTPKT